MLFSPSNPIIFRTVSSLRDSERHTDECHGLSSVQEYDAIGKWGRESARDFYSPVHLKKILFGKESQPWVVSGGKTTKQEMQLFIVESNARTPGSLQCRC